MSWNRAGQIPFEGSHAQTFLEVDSERLPPFAFAQTRKDSREAQRKIAFEAKVQQMRKQPTVLEAFFAKNKGHILPVEISSIFSKDPTEDRFEFLVELINKKAGTCIPQLIDLPTLASLQTALDSLSEKEQKEIERISYLRRCRTENSSVEEVSKVCTLLSRFGYHVQPLLALIAEAVSTVDYGSYKLVLKHLGFSPPEDENTLFFLERELNIGLVTELQKLHLAISLDPHPSVRLHQNLETQDRFVAQANEIYERFLEIERRCSYIPQEVFSLMRGLPTLRRWEQLIQWCNRRSASKLPLEISEKNRDQILSTIITRIEEKVVFENSVDQRAFFVSHPPSRVQIEEALAKKGSSSLSQALQLVRSMRPELISVCMPMVEDLLMQLALMHVPEDEAAQTIGQLIFLLDHGITLHDLPQDFHSASQWIGHRAIACLRDQQKLFEAKKSELFSEGIYTLVSVHKILLPQAISELLITSEGFVNVPFCPLVQKVFIPPKKERDGICEHIARILSHLQSSEALSAKLSSIDIPPRTLEGYSVVRLCVGKSPDQPVTIADTRRVCLATLLTWHRQGDLGDCFVASLYEFAADEATIYLLDDFAELLATGALSKNYNTKSYSAAGLPWPALPTCEILSSFSQEALLSLYDFSPVQRAIHELGAISREQWHDAVKRAFHVHDIRELFLAITPDINAVERALVAIESHQESPLLRMWLSAVGSLAFVVTDDWAMSGSNSFYLALLDALQSYADTIFTSSIQPQKEHLAPLFRKLHPCLVAQSAKPHTPALSLVMFYEDKGHKQLVSKQDMQGLLKEAVGSVFPRRNVSKKGEEILFEAYASALRKRMRYDLESSSVAEWGKTLFFPKCGGLTILDIFGKQLIPQFWKSPRSFTRPLDYILFAKDLASDHKRELSIPIVQGRHAFRLFLNHKSATALFSNPEQALKEQEAYATAFRMEQKPFSAWLTILLTNSLVHHSAAYSPLEHPETIGTVEEFVEKYLQQLPVDETNKSVLRTNLPLRFLVHACTSSGRGAIIHFADTNWAQTATNEHVGLLYSPFEGSYITVVVDAKETPASVEKTTPHLENVQLPIQSILDRIFSETKSKQLSAEHKEVQTQLEHLQRDFARALFLIEEYIKHASEEVVAEVSSRLGEWFSQPTQKRKKGHFPTNFEEALIHAKQIQQLYQELISSTAQKTDVYPSSLATRSSTLLANPEGLYGDIQGMIRQRQYFLSLYALFDRWGKNEQIRQEILEDAKGQLQLLAESPEQLHQAEALLQCIATFETLHLFESYQGSPWCGVWLNEKEQLCVGRIWFKQNTSGIGFSLQQIFDKTNPLLPLLSKERKKSMHSSLSFLQKFYPSDIQIQESYECWKKAL
jgi:hypothetical protein